MAPRRETVPDAWDDDWEPEAAAGASLVELPKPEPPMTKAELLARHEESNRRLWQSAEDKSEQIQYLPATNDVTPAPSAFKPVMKVLSRRPARPQGGAALLDDDDDAAARAAAQPSPEEVRLRQQREREEKQRKYDEARAKIFGEPPPAPSLPSGPHASGASTPGTVTPPSQAESGGGRSGHRSRGRGRGGGGGGHRGGGGEGNSRAFDRSGNSLSSSNSNSNNFSVDDLRRPPAPPTRELYDPNSSSPRPGASSTASLASQRRGGAGGAGDATCSSPRAGTPREEDQVIRTPRGPDPSGRGGFGFARSGSTPKDG